MNLSQRLQSELIGPNYKLEEQPRPGISDHDAKTLAIGANGSKDKQRDRVPAVTATIASDLKGMLPIPPFVSFEACRTAADYQERQALRELVKAQHAAVDRYCGLTGEEKSDE
jgi:hypothetical protein